MFEQSLLDMAQMGRTKKPVTVFISFLLQSLMIGILILVPLIYTEALPKHQLLMGLVAPPPPPPPPPPAVTPVITKVIREFEAGKLLAPKEIPKEIAMIKEEELPPPSAAAGVVGGVPGGVPGGTPGGVIGGIISSTPLVAPPPPPRQEAPKRIRVGGQVQQAKLLNQPKPVYPPLAKQARIQGTVRLEAVISKDGTIEQLRVVSGHPLLVQSALEAVRQWKYQPTYLNSEPVEVATTIDVNFTLSQ
ncbi:MAG: energy transducer TonB [Terriglobales bacterium]